MCGMPVVSRAQRWGKKAKGEVPRLASVLLCYPLIVPLQVNFNEPLSMLQRLTEDLEYHELLDKAVKCESSTEQMCFVAAFSVSSYSTTVHRTAKPFNPLLGETYELDRLEEFGFRSLCEQVSWGLRRGSACLPCCSCPAKAAVP